MTEMIYRSMSMRRHQADPQSWFATIDRTSLTAIIILFFIGLLISMASTPTLALRLGMGDYYFVFRQLVFGGIAIVIMLALSRLSPTFVRRLGVLGFLGGFALLIVLPFIGSDFGKGAVRWVSLGFVSVQPSEFLKPGFAIMIAWLVSAAKTSDGPPGRMMATILTGIIILLLALQPDFGQSTLILMCYVSIMFVAGSSWVGMATIVGIVAVGAKIAYLTSSHFAGRINGFLNETIDPHTQIGYASNAISNGGFFGAGLGEGTVKYSLPDAHTDFVIAVVAEEYGVLACLLIISIFALIIVRSFIRLMQTQDNFVRYAGTGLTTLIGAQSMINLGVAARVFPTKGMTLPLISYGGSSVLAIGITFGLLLALTRHRAGMKIGDR